MGETVEGIDVSVNLPIDVVPNSNPPRFRWRQMVNTPTGRHSVEHNGMLPAVVESAVATLVELAKQLWWENEALRKQVARMQAQGGGDGKKPEPVKRGK